MRTSGLISTISYNSKVFLCSKLQELIDSHKISDYMFIEHEPEDDELKNHIHLVIEPNTLIDSMDIQEYLVQLDPLNLDHPLKCVNFRRTTDLDEWILYVEHNPAYLLSKGQSRKYIYSREDFYFADEDTFARNYRHAYVASKFALEQERLKNSRELIKGSIAPVDAFMSGQIPLNLANSINSIMFMQSDFERRTNRNGKEGHD